MLIQQHSRRTARTIGWISVALGAHALLSRHRGLLGVQSLRDMALPELPVVGQNVATCQHLVSMGEIALALVLVVGGIQLLRLRASAALPLALAYAVSIVYVCACGIAWVGPWFRPSPGLGVLLTTQSVMPSLPFRFGLIATHAGMTLVQVAPCAVILWLLERGGVRHRAGESVHP